MIPSFPMFFKMNVVIGMIMFLVMTTMISDFSAVLLDVKEKNILLPRPVDGKTLNAAKLIHIVVYLFCITIAIAGGALIVGLIRYGILFFLMFLIEMVLICSFLILVTSIFYYAVISIFDGEKLKDIINYFQIALTVFMTLMYQFTGRIFSFSNMNISTSLHFWNFLLPSSWFAAPFMLITNKFDKNYLVLSLIGIIVPIITITLYVKVVATQFESNLQKMNSAGSSQCKSSKKDNFQRVLANVFCHHPLERVFFRFTLQMLDNERKLKLRIYPSLAFAVIFPFIFFFNLFSGEQSFSETLAEIANGKYYIYLYLSVAFLASLFPMISLSENYKGAWIYKALPVDDPVIVLKGAFKAFLLKYIVSVFLLISLIFMFVFGLKVLPGLFLIFLNLLIVMLVLFRFSKRELPFYKDFQYAQNGTNVNKVLSAFGLCALLAGIHYVALIISFGLMINIALSSLFIIFLWHRSFRFSWEDMERNI
ncbi:ABC transporter permease [Aminipila terrae]|uniref:ABC transporter permease n=1 Tax=Aminipila terrae TaxID=2697030 RepID=A0A6P1MI58_9FIRM|nr:ABC transporter permease [Aminipila terrae]QHI73421.1 ABC transporter permease [Aminipila terrae]